MCSVSGGVRLQGLFWSMAYALFSIATTLLNKTVLSSFKFDFPLILLLWQNTFTFLVFFILAQLGSISVQPPSIRALLRWLPLNLLFIANIASSANSVRLLSVSTVTIFKNLQTVIIALGDRLLFGQQQSPGVTAALIIMGGGSISIGFVDLDFNLTGYAWMVSNILIGTAYVLYMRFASHESFTGVDSVYFNNGLSIPFLLGLSVLSGEASALSSGAHAWGHNFFVFFLASAVSALFVSLSSFMLVKTTSPTTYSIVGALNKVPTTILGVIIFNTSVNATGALGMCAALLGGVVYAITKGQQFSIRNSASDKDKKLGNARV